MSAENYTTAGSHASPFPSFEKGRQRGIRSIQSPRKWSVLPAHPIAPPGVWESVHNPDFNSGEFATFRRQVGLNSYTLTPKPLEVDDR